MNNNFLNLYSIIFNQSYLDTANLSLDLVQGKQGEEKDGFDISIQYPILYHTHRGEDGSTEYIYTNPDDGRFTTL